MNIIEHDLAHPSLRNRQCPGSRQPPEHTTTIWNETHGTCPECQQPFRIRNNQTPNH